MRAERAQPPLSINVTGIKPVIPLSYVKITRVILAAVLLPLGYAAGGYGGLAAAALSLLLLALPTRKGKRLITRFVA